MSMDGDLSVFGGFLEKKVAIPDKCVRYAVLEVGTNPSLLSEWFGILEINI